MDNLDSMLVIIGISEKSRRVCLVVVWFEYVMLEPVSESVKNAGIPMARDSSVEM